MLQIIKTDAVNVRGERTVDNGDLELLEGFDFNNEGRLNATLFAPYTSDVDQALGELGISIPAFVPSDTIAFPVGATHFKFLAGAAEIDFENEEFNFVKAVSADIALGPQLATTVDLDLTLTANSPSNLFLVLGLDFMQEVNGAMYPLRNGNYNPLTIVEIVKPV
jgi:hypothetical protein